jgi:stage IV sporulation protein FB
MISIPGRIPIHIFPFFWLLIIMIGWLNTGNVPSTAIWAVIILSSVLVHEFGHALTALFFGQSAEISLVGLGGVTSRRGPELSKWKDFLIVFNGPLAGFLLCMLAYALLNGVDTNNTTLIYALKVTVRVNLFWTILNLLPVLPMDGGHLLRIILESLFGFKGVKIALFLSMVLAALLALFFFSTDEMLLGALFLMMGFETYRSWADVRSMTPEDNDKHLQSLLQEALEELRVGKRDEALAKFFLLREQAPKGAINTTAIEYIARILSEKGQYKQALEWLQPIEKKLSPPYLCLLQQLAFKLQDWEKTTSVGQEAYRQEPLPETALLNALAYGIMGQPKPAVGWLRCSIQSGLNNIADAVRKREFDSIRHTPEFENFEKSLR